MKLSEFSRIRLERARDLKNKGAYLEAEEELKEALEEQPDSPLLTVSLAELYLRQERLPEARILVEPILSSDPNHPQALFILGEIFFKEDKLNEALECFRTAYQKDPGPYLLRRIARTLREMGRYKEALETLDALRADGREDIRFLKEKALTLNRMKQWDEALHIYETVQRLDPEDSFVRKEIYRLKSLDRQDHQVIEELKTILKLPSKKDDPQLHGLLGQKLKEAGKLREAAAEFHAAWNLSPKNLYFLKQKGFCHYSLGEYEEAVNALGQVFRKDPNDYRVRSTLKRIYATTNNLQGFITLLEDVLKDHPENVKLIGILKGAVKEASAKSPKNR